MVIKHTAHRGESHINHLTMHFSKCVLIVEQGITVFVSRRWIEVMKLGCLVSVHSDWEVIRESIPGTNSSEAYVVEYAQ